jgi:hypothetical protein
MRRKWVQSILDQLQRHLRPDLPDDLLDGITVPL